jgi:hypothetical protein
MKYLLVLLTIISFLFIGSSSFAVDKQITLAWDHDGVDLAGFKIHYGTESDTYTTDVDILMASLCSIYSISPEEFCHKLTLSVPEEAVTTFYLAATAYDAETPPNESSNSNEVSLVYDFELPPVVVDLAASFDKPTSTLSFTWTYETDWLPKIEKWSLWESETSGTGFTKVADIPYDPSVAPPYTTEVVIAVSQEEVTKYYVLTAHRGAENNNAFSSNSNEVTVTIDKMPPKSPFEFKIKIR